ncbi:hypothetical protein DIURU_002554 [Diutina rugosa]|uniref:Nibrin second BRCT domain-containing protein n=1 Tax=Diutina rugosa TaxID=5481 RepID=A0A642UPR7_DIURU|nr:uncharacterized protein DIURU_002554 [Diutina rugosa]KAA8903126.1 hypothetical protein DIURU_002554 [Diutina rugosa]
MSRAKSTINGVIQKLSKGEQERSVTYTEPITIELKCDGPPIKIEREVLKLYGNSLILNDAGVIYQNVPLAEAQLCLPSSFKVVQYEAKARAIGLLTQDWENYVANNITDVDGWWYNIDYDKFGGVAPDPRRKSLLKGVTAVVYASKLIGILEAMGCAEVIQVSGSDDVVALLSDKNPPFMVIDRMIGEYPETTTDDLYLAIDDVDSKHIAQFGLTRKRAMPQESNTPTSSQLTNSSTSEGTKRRKRPRYEKTADKMAFFDIKVEPETEKPEGNDATDSAKATTEPEADVSSTTDSAPKIEENAEDGASSATGDTNDEAKAEESETSQEPIVKPSKRSIETPEETTTTHAKRFKFEPKVSLVEAIKRAKSKAEDSLRSEFGETQEEADEESLQEAIGNLANLAIVEVRDIPMRSSQDYNTQKSFDERYNGRKNFKKFSKVQQVVPIFRRSFVSVEVVRPRHDVGIDFAEGLNQAAEAEEQMEADFSGLFVPADEEFASSATPTPPPPQQRRQAPARASARRTITVSRESDSEDDGPQFQFS